MTLLAPLHEGRKPKRARGPFCKIPVHRFQITPQEVRPRRFANGAGLQIEQQLEFPFGESVAPDSTPDYLLDELAERRQVSTPRSRIRQMKECSFPQKILSLFCDSVR